MTETSPPTIQALASAYYAGCIKVLQFVEDFVAPIVVKETEAVVGDQTFLNPMYSHLAFHAMTGRLHNWLRTLRKLDAAGDFQAILTAGRALFEMAVDLTLIRFEEHGSMSKMRAWHMDAKLRWARQRIENQLDSNRSAEGFVASMEQHIGEMIHHHWPTPEQKKRRQRGRWTGRDLLADATMADELAPSGFLGYYVERYKAACWQVHGSGVIGMMEIPEALIPQMAAEGLRDAERFSRVACRLLLELLGKFDHEAKARFDDLEFEIAHAYEVTLAYHEQLAARDRLEESGNLTRPKGATPSASVTSTSAASWASVGEGTPLAAAHFRGKCSGPCAGHAVVTECQNTE